MDALVSPKFKSKVEQFYFENLSASKENLSDTGLDSLKVTEARKRAYSGDGRKSYFTFDSNNAEIIKRQRNKRMTFWPCFNSWIFLFEYQRMRFAVLGLLSCTEDTAGNKSHFQWWKFSWRSIWHVWLASQVSRTVKESEPERSSFPRCVQSKNKWFEK